MLIPFHRPSFTELEICRSRSAIASADLRSGGRYSKWCLELLAQRLGQRELLLTGSATVALELAMILAEIGPGDEVIMPAFTFVSCANAVVLRGGTPVFVDIRPDTLNIDVEAVRSAVTDRTRAVLAIHYAGVPFAVAELSELARERGLLVIEDAAHAFGSAVDGCEAGTFGDLAVFSFHHTKNISCGEGGLLAINNASFVDRARVVHENGTNRHGFEAGKTLRYEWKDIGSSFAPSDLTAALLSAQLERADEILSTRRALWDSYHQAFQGIERAGVGRPTVPKGVRHNGHIYYLLMPDAGIRAQLIEALAGRSIQATTHYVPLDRTPGGRRFGRASGTLANTHSVSERLIRLPLWTGMGSLQDEVVQATLAAIESLTQRANASLKASPASH
jgi:Predicted pyridoxal phosphate-dependent enzyme apparently involved in regulation of cell wall biogenesis